MRVLHAWRLSGVRSAKYQLFAEYRSGFDGLLLAELHKRLVGDPGPFLLIDGLWLAKNSFGGISRVWNNILNTFSLPGIFSESAPIAFIDYASNFNNSYSPLIKISAPPVDPLNLMLVSGLSSRNSEYISQYKADVFCSSWISNSGLDSPSCAEIALVHDCIPEHFTPLDPLLLPLRQRWISGASSLLSVSNDTSNDLSCFYSVDSKTVSWCHISPESSFYDVVNPRSSAVMQDILKSLGMSQPFIFLPGSGVSGSYKNPELLAKVLTHSSLHNLSLLISGINSIGVRQSLVSKYPTLCDRIYSAGFSDSELLSVFQHATAVVIPSLIEGFGLPVIEVMLAGGLPVISDVFGLREAGAEASLRFDPHDNTQLISILQMLLHSSSRSWIHRKLIFRMSQRLRRLNIDLFGLALLAEARRSPH